MFHLPEKTRSIELYLAAVIFLYGVVLLLPGDTLSHPSYSTLLGWVRIFPGNEAAFGFLVMSVGIGRWLAVIVNGYWRPNAAIRLAGCCIGSLFWTSLLFSFFSADLEYRPAMLAFLIPAMALECFAAMRCAEDAFDQDSFGLRGRHRVRMGGRGT